MEREERRWGEKVEVGVRCKCDITLTNVNTAKAYTVLLLLSPKFSDPFLIFISA